MNMTQQGSGMLKFSPSNETFNLTQGPFGSGNLIHFDDEESNKSENENRRKSIAINLLNSPSEESVQNYQGNFQFQRSPRGNSEV